MLIEIYLPIDPRSRGSALNEPASDDILDSKPLGKTNTGLTIHSHIYQYTQVSEEPVLTTGYHREIQQTKEYRHARVKRFS